MKYAAVEYGFIPKEIRDCLDLTVHATVSSQIEDQITNGTIGPEGFIVSVSAAVKESLHFAGTSYNLKDKEKHLEKGAIFQKMLKSSDLQRYGCEVMIDQCNALQREGYRAGDKMSARFYKLGAERWAAVWSSIESTPPRSTSARARLQLVR